MNNILAWAIFASGFAQLSVLIASATVPIQLQWHKSFAVLPRLHRQLAWCYAGYIFATIFALGLLCITYSNELAHGSSLARAVCIYGAAFWGIRLALQGIFDVKPYLTKWWLRAGYHALTIWFIGFVTVYAWGAMHTAT